MARTMKKATTKPAAKGGRKATAGKGRGKVAAKGSSGAN